VLDAIRRFVQEHLGGPADAEGAPIRPDRVQLAACALLLELAHADGDFSPEEERHIARALLERFGLDDDAGRELMRLAELERAQSLDHFQFTRLIAAEWEPARRMTLAEVMWGVILADGRLNDLETHLVRKMGSLLQLTPGDLAEARRRAEA
jgi:uncharacterized tellurite resistance protein B-like protein